MRQTRRAGLLPLIAALAMAVIPTAAAAGTKAGGLVTPTQGGEGPVPSIHCVRHYSDPLLGYGSTGNAVRHAQCLLNAGWGWSLERDGIFGPRTDHAVRVFQRHHGLHVDGLIGDRTWRELHKAYDRPCWPSC